MNEKRIAVASDHRGFPLKSELIQALSAKGYLMKDCGTFSEDTCDYPDFGSKAALAVRRGDCDFGIVICYSGIGMSITANKIKGIRASLCSTIETAEFARKHNDANVLAFGAGFVSKEMAVSIALAWLETAFEGGRHERRVRKISELEKRCGGQEAKSQKSLKTVKQTRGK